MRSLPEVSDASAKLSPLLRNGDALYVIDGPVAGSGYDWFEIHAPRADLTGWVAAAAKTGEDWIRPVSLGCTMGASPDPIVDAIGYELMHLACYREDRAQRDPVPGSTGGRRPCAARTRSSGCASQSGWTCS